jgi:hypothetical protein
MLNLAANFRVTIDQLASCPDPILVEEATIVKGHIESYDAAVITEAELKVKLEELRDSMGDNDMVKTTITNILETPVS